MWQPTDLPSRTSIVEDRAVFVRSSDPSSSHRLFRLFRRTALALAVPAALLASTFSPTTSPATVTAAPVAASVELANNAAAGTLQLGVPRLNATTGTVTASALNMRTGPSTGYTIIAVLPYGTQGTVLDTSNGWYKVGTSRGTGWVSGTYFRVGSTTPVAQPAPAGGVTAARATMVPNGRFISGWGAARSGGRTHQGEDIAAPSGSPIYAPARLTIVSNTWNSLGGWTVIGRDAKGRHWYFAHMNSQSSVSGTIAKGHIIGYVGMTGNAQGTTPHLHYQVSSSGWTWANPVYVLQNYPDVP